MPNIKKILYVPQMHCTACEFYLEKKLKTVDGVVDVVANIKQKSIEATFQDETQIDTVINTINELIGSDGYSVSTTPSKKPFWSRDLGVAVGISAIFITLFILLQKSGFLDQFSPQTITYPAIFFVGVIASLSSCMVVTGGFILTFSAAVAKLHKNYTTNALIGLHVARVVGFFVLGGILGLIGSAAAISPTTTGIINISLAIIMILAALSMLNITLFSTNILQKKAQSLVNVLSQKGSLYVGIITGILTFFLPCGFTQSMQLYAVSTGNFMSGALVMLFFALGTLPMLILMSVFSVHIQNSRWNSVLSKIVGIFIFAFALTNIVTGLRLLGIL